MFQIVKSFTLVEWLFWPAVAGIAVLSLYNTVSFGVELLGYISPDEAIACVKEAWP